MGFLKDLIHSAALENGEGKRSKNMRWSTSTHRVMQVLMRLGGQRSILRASTSMFCDMPRTSELLRTP